MRRLIAFVAFAAAACGGVPGGHDNAAEWRVVLNAKKAADAPTATTHEKQVYADALAAFVDNHPSHSRAREVYRRIQLDFAKDLAGIGRYQDAIRIYRAVLTHDPANAAAAHGLNDAIDRLAVSRPKLLMLERGMSQHDVAKIIGKPIPGWTVTNERPDATIECWYYRTTEGGVAGVYFRDGELFAAEERSHEKLVPLTLAAVR
jgi:hypothetical protein